MIVSGIFPPMKMAPWTIAPRMIVPQIIASKEKCRLDNCPPRIISLGLLLLDKHPTDNCPLNYAQRKLPLQSSGNLN